MTDAHMHILRLVARQRRRYLDDHDAADGTGGTASVHRRLLERAATRTTARVAEAQARRRERRSGYTHGIADRDSALLAPPLHRTKRRSAQPPR